MTDHTARAPDAAPEDETVASPEEAVATPQAAGATETAGAPETAATPDSLALLAQEAADLKDRLLRALAEMENLRRRTEREVADARSYAIAGFARDLLAVADNMRRALDAVDPAARATADTGTKALIDGVELTERELVKVLEKHGVRKLDPQGARFDPYRHQAMFEMPDESVPAGTVVQVVQAGYTLGDRVLRPALVGVAKGGPKAAPTGAEGPQPATAAPPANDNTGGPTDPAPGSS
jgi:molecular chaperone GrpE